MTEDANPKSTWTFEGCSDEEIFSEAFLLDLSALMQLRPTQENQFTLRQGLLGAAATFVSAVYDFERTQPLDAENKRLDEVAKDATRLARSLRNLYEFGEVAGRLTEEIETNPIAYRGDPGISLAKLMDRERGYPFFHLINLLSDLWASAERAQIRYEPSHEEKLAQLEAKIAAGDTKALERAVMTDKLPPTRLLAKGQKPHRPKGKPYLVLIEAFAGTWTALGAGTYGAGHTVAGLQGPKSRAVDVLHLIAQRLYPDTTRDNIATAFRTWKKSRRQNSQNLGQ